MRECQGVVLILHDDTVLDYSGLETLADDLGQIGDGRGRGYYCHNSLAVVAETRQVLGLAARSLHRRRKVPPGEKRKQRRQRPDRNLLWKRGSQDIPAAASWANCGWTWPTGERTLRSSWITKKRWARSTWCVRSTTASLSWKTRINRKRGGSSCTIGRGRCRRRPRASWKSRPSPVSRPERCGWGASLDVGHAAAAALCRRRAGRALAGVGRAPRDRDRSPAAGVGPLEWILLTNVPVHCAPDAWQRVAWYRLRWIVEEYHQGQKTGCDIEELQFRHRDRLEPVIALLSVVALTLLELRDLSRRPEAQSQAAIAVLPWAWVRLLSRWRHKEERPAWTVHDFYYALARLGGHQNRKHDHPPGWLVLWRGWTKLQAMLEGAAVAGDETSG